MSGYRIENNVPIPKPGQGRAKYPWAVLEIGQSFIVPCEEWEREQTMNSLTSCRNNAQRGNKRFALRNVKDGVRVWRVA